MGIEYSYADKANLLREIIGQQEENLKALPRKRSWRASEKAMAAATYEKRKAIAEQVIEDLFRLESLNH